MASAVDVLLKLLEHADGSELLVLMEPENVLALLRADGQTDEDTRRALSVDKKLPGELLLGLFEKGRTAKDLLETLGPAAVAAVEAERKKSAERAASAAAPTPAPAPTRRPAVSSAATSAPSLAAARPTGTAGVIGLVLVLVAAIVPSLFSLLDPAIALALGGLGLVTVLGVVAGVGALGGALATPASGRRWVTSIAGALASVGGCLAVLAYGIAMAAWGRTSLLRIEIALACVLGMLPAVGLVALFGRR